MTSGANVWALLPTSVLAVLSHPFAGLDRHVQELPQGGYPSVLCSSAHNDSNDHYCVRNFFKVLPTPAQFVTQLTGPRGRGELAHAQLCIFIVTPLLASINNSRFKGLSPVQQLFKRAEIYRYFQGDGTNSRTAGGTRQV